MHDVLRIFRGLLMVIVLAPVALYQSAHGLQNAPPEAPAALASASDAEIHLLRQELSSDRWEVRDPAANRVMEQGPKMMSAKAHDRAADLALAATLAVPGDLYRVEVLQSLRVRALTAAGRKAEALAAAKGLYNVNGMGTTREAISLLADTLVAAHPEDKDIRRRFLAEQLEGSRAATQPYTGSALARNPALLLSKIKIDPQPYEAALKRESAENFGALMARGNLLLLADKPQEALTAFQKAYEIAPDDRVASAIESMARAMKTMDGTIGRANAFLLSVRPKSTE